jgi:hypothetical protein
MLRWYNSSPSFRSEYTPSNTTAIKQVINIFKNQLIRLGKKQQAIGTQRVQKRTPCK